MDSSKFDHSYLVCCVCRMKWEGMSYSHLGCFTRIDCQKWMEASARTLYQKGLNNEVFDNYVLKGVVFFFREDSFAFYSFSLTQSYCNM